MNCTTRVSIEREQKGRHLFKEPKMRERGKPVFMARVHDFLPHPKLVAVMRHLKYSHHSIAFIS